MEKDNPKDESRNNDENRQNMTSDNNTHAEVGNPNQPSRTTFTNLSQVEADLALARTLQDQERAYMMLTMNRGGSDQESWESGSYVVDDDNEFDQLNSEYDGSYAEGEEDAFDVHAERGNQGVEMDPAYLSNDEAYARAIQDTEGQEMSTRLRSHTRTNRMVTEEEEEDDFMDDHGDDSQGSWDDVDPDEMSYEELIALGEVVGTESRGLSVDSMASLRTVIYQTKNSLNGSSETCVICRLDYEDGDNLILLSCKHSYHSECITNWLQINKVCPVCSTEVTTSSTAP